MTGAINNIAGSLAGTQGQANVGKREIRKQDEQAERRRGVRDEFKKTIGQVLEADAVRSAKDSTQEESNEDRQEHDVGYHKPDEGEDPQRLDLSA
jgi:Mg-chelatase subunit ChlI